MTMWRSPDWATSETCSETFRVEVPGLLHSSCTGTQKPTHTTHAHAWIYVHRNTRDEIVSI